MNSTLRFFLFLADEILISLLAIALILYFQIPLVPSIILVLILIIISSFTIYIFLPQFKHPMTGIEAMIGMKGTALDCLDPNGKITIKGEIWNGQSIDGRIEKGEELIVVEVKNLLVLVKHAER